MKTSTLIFTLFFLMLFPLLQGQNSDTSLLVRWTFDNHVQDSSGNEFHGEASNITYSKGIFGQAAVFDSPRDVIYFPAKELSPPDEICILEQGAISIWFNYSSIAKTGRVLPLFYFGESNAGSPHNSLIIEIGHAEDPQNRKLYFTIVNTSFCFDSKENLKENTWYHFVAVVGPDGNTGYLNGQEMVNRHYNLVSDSSYTDFFADVPIQELLSVGYGRYGQNDAFFHYKGMVDDVRIYKKPLSAEEVKYLYDAAGNVNDNTTSDLEPTYKNVAYGPHERNVLDLWLAESDEPAPIVVFIHGGGFINGSKDNAKQKTKDIEHLLSAGISYASISYRLRSTDEEHLYDGIRLDTIMLDCARAIQFLRYKADVYNIDKELIGAYGGSAGGGASIWIGTMDEFAEPNNPDPVLRESTRLKAIGHLNSQATYNWPRWPEILSMDQEIVENNIKVEDILLLQMTRDEMVNTPEGKELCEFLDMYEHITPDDPPMYTQSANPDIEPGNVIHHPRHAKAVKARCDSVGVECVLILRDTPADEIIDIDEFFIQHLTKQATTQMPMKNTGDFQVYPNPASNYITIVSPKIQDNSLIKIMDLSGKVLYEGRLSKEKTQIETRHFETGVYILQVYLGKNIIRLVIL